jgi:hypothetical protein
MRLPGIVLSARIPCDPSPDSGIGKLHKPRIGNIQPQTRRTIIAQLSCQSWLVAAFAGKLYPQHLFALALDQKPHCVKRSLGG